jgi:hypothetical protein
MSSMDGMRSRVLVCRRHYGGFPVALRGSLESGVVHATSGVASRKCGVTIAGDRADIGCVCGYLAVVARVRGVFNKDMIG